MRHMERRPVGCRTDNLFYLESVLSGNEAFENDLLSLPSVKRMGHSYGYPGSAMMGSNWVRLNDPDNFISVGYLMCDTAAFKLFDFDTKAMYGQLEEGQWLLTQGLLESQLGMPMSKFDPDSLSVWYKHNVGYDLCGVVGDFAINSAAYVVDEKFGAVQIVGARVG